MRHQKMPIPAGTTTPTDIKGEKAVLWHLGDMEIHDGLISRLS